MNELKKANSYFLVSSLKSEKVGTILEIAQNIINTIKNSISQLLPLWRNDILSALEARGPGSSRGGQGRLRSCCYKYSPRDTGN